MKNMMSRIAQVTVILVLLTSSFSLTGCSNSGPTPPISVDLSFPHGAPRLNQTAELRCVVKTDISADNVTVRFNLPDGLQFVSGNLSAQFGSISKGDVRELKAVIKPIKTGNYTIEARLSLVSSDPGFSLGPGRYQIYLSVSEKSAEWGKYPPWNKPIPDPFPPPKNLPAPPPAPAPTSSNRTGETNPSNSPVPCLCPRVQDVADKKYGACLNVTN